MLKALHLFHVAAIVVFAAAPAVSLAADQGALKNGAIEVTDSMHAKVTVVDINKKEHELTVRDETGNEIVLIVSREVRNFAQIKKGDIVEVEYHRAAVSTLEKASDTNVTHMTATVERAPAGAKPSARVTQTRPIVATVLDIDAKNRLLTVQGPQGGIVTVKVPDNLKAFDSLKKGDKISAIYTEAVAISVKSPGKKK